MSTLKAISTCDTLIKIEMSNKFDKKNRDCGM